MEMNTRLQVEHPVTECTTGIDLVKLQIHVARGGRLEGERPRTTGHAIEVRLNAEDPDNGFAPAPGAIQRFRMLTGPGVRIDTGVAEGDAVPPEFDSMIAKIIAYGQNRKEALSRLQRALRESVVVIKGGASNKPFLLESLNRAEVQRDKSTPDGWTGWLPPASTSRSVTPMSLWFRLPSRPTTRNWRWSRRSSMLRRPRGRPQVRSDIGRSRGTPVSRQSLLLENLSAWSATDTAWSLMSPASMRSSIGSASLNIGSLLSVGVSTSYR